MTWPCMVCGATISRRPSHFALVKTCSKACSAIYRSELARQRGPNSGAFKKGHKSWIAGTKGIRNSPATEFKPGQIPGNKTPVGTVRVSHKKTNGELRARVKIGEPSVWRDQALVVWENLHGPIPKGMIVHHHDRDSLNNEIGNLRLMTRAKHMREHMDELLKKRGHKRRKQQYDETSDR